MEAVNPLHDLGGGKVTENRGKASGGRDTNINTKATNYADLYNYDESNLAMVKRHVDEFPQYEKNLKDHTGTINGGLEPDLM